MSNIQPQTLSTLYPNAYLAGVLRGDGWISAGHPNSIHGYLCLRVSDLDFANAFAKAIHSGYGVECRARRDERGYWFVRTYNGYARYNGLRALEPVPGEPEAAAWLRGLFDSEGNVNLSLMPAIGPRSYDRRVSFYSTELSTLNMADTYLRAFGLGTRNRTVKPSQGHKGSKPVYELAIRGSQENYARFAAMIGSNIRRKRERLDAIPLSYVADMSAFRREMQARGVITRKARNVY